MFKRLSEISTELNELRENGRVRGFSIGWNWDLLPYTVMLGSTTYMAAAPASGKTELIKEIQINLSCLHGLNHVIFTPETGSVADIYAELCHSYLGQPYIKGYNSMSESDKAYAEQFVDSHFFVVDTGDKDLSVEQFYKLVDQVEQETGKTIHTTLIDPWNELVETYISEDLGREDKYLSRILGKVRKNARETNRHHFILTHVRDQKVVNVADISYYPPPHAREFAGGQVWFRKGNSVLIPWRPPFGLSGGDNIAYEQNELHLRIAKTKPKGTSKNGTYKLYLDTDRYQYYLKVGNDKIYADRGEGNKLETELQEQDKPLPLNLGFDDEGIEF